MSTAVLISGQARTFARCYPSQKWQVFRKLNDPWFYVSVADDAQAKDMERLRDDFAHVSIEVVPQPTLPEPANVEQLCERNPFPLVGPVQSMLRQFWHLRRVWEIAGRQHQTYVRIRPDLFFHGLGHVGFIGNHTCVTPWWSRWGGVNDRFAIMGWHAALAYFTTFDRIDALLKAGAPLHPESLLAASLDDQSVAIDATLPAIFSTIRMDGAMLRPDYNGADLADLLITLSQRR